MVVDLKNLVRNIKLPEFWVLIINRKMESEF